MFKLGFIAASYLNLSSSDFVDSFDAFLLESKHDGNISKKEVEKFRAIQSNRQQFEKKKSKKQDKVYDKGTIQE
jgi:hypothetical protein